MSLKSINQPINSISFHEDMESLPVIQVPVKIYQLEQERKKIRKRDKYLDHARELKKKKLWHMKVTVILQLVQSEQSSKDW